MFHRIDVVLFQGAVGMALTVGLRGTGLLLALLLLPLYLPILIFATGAGGAVAP